MEQIKENSRNTAMDIIRCVALYLVISVHFFLNNGYYSQIVIGKRMYVMTVMRTAFMTCVPLFVILSGYLMCNKEIHKKYYWGIVKTIGIYILASIACIVYKNTFLNENVSLVQAFFGILNFSSADYSWYIEMYIGLFLLIPFLNILYNNLKLKKHKLLLVLTLLILTSIPNVVNIFNFSVQGWWKTPILSNDYVKIMPNWWEGIYPLTYYFIGCYLKEFNLKIKKSVNILLLAAFIILFGTFNFYRSYGAVFIRGAYQNWGALPNVILTVLLFVLLANINTEKIPVWCKNLLGKLSGLCLGGYLVSFIFDSIFYQKLNNTVTNVPQRLGYYIIIVPLVFVCSLILSFIINAIYNILRIKSLGIYKWMKSR